MKYVRTDDGIYEAEQCEKTFDEYVFKDHKHLGNIGYKSNTIIFSINLLLINC